MAQDGFEYAAVSICLTFNAIALACLVVYFFGIKSEKGYRLKFLTFTRALYCMIIVCYMCYELYSLKHNQTHATFDFLISFGLFGCSTTSSWLLVYEYMLGAFELRNQLNKIACTRLEIR